MRLLELFSGSGSVGRAFVAQGWEVTSVDIDPRYPADIHADVLELDYRRWPRGHFDAVWASPPCTHYSIARTTARAPRDLEGADALVRRTKEIIDYLAPCVWWIENPDSGLLKTRDVLRLVPYHVVDYCRYGSPYRKRTRLWTNVPAHVARLQLCEGLCAAFANGRHGSSAQRGPARAHVGTPHDRFTLLQLYALPTRLCAEIERATRSWVFIHYSLPS